MRTAVLERPQGAPVDADARPRLSALMRQGARRHPQRSGAMFKDGRTCALGAVVVALLGEEAPAFLTSPQVGPGLAPLVLERTGIDLTQLVWLPEGIYGPHGRHEPLGVAIVGLNDTWHWSREAIAGWLESFGL